MSLLIPPVDDPAFLQELERRANDELRKIKSADQNNRSGLNVGEHFWGDAVAMDVSEKAAYKLEEKSA